MPFVEDRSVLSRPASPPDNVVRYGELPEHVADIRYGKNNAERRPLIVVIHGGFWRPAFDRTHTAPMCEAIASAGWTVASIEYRRIPGDPDATVQDVIEAVLKVPALAHHHSGRTIVMGHSAGGHLCLYAAAKSASPALLGALALAPAADLQMAEQLKLGDGAASAFLGVPASQRADLDPARLPSPRVVTIVHGLQDEIVPIALSEAYAAKHPATRLMREDRCGHFAVIDPLSSAWPTILNELRGFT